MKNIFLETERLYLRPLETGDAALLAACNNDPAVRESFFTHTPTSVARQAERIARLYTPGDDYIPLAICLWEADRAIGVTALHRVDLVSGAAVFSICLADREEWGKGYAREATDAMIAYAFDILNLHRLQLHVWTGNEAALRTYKKAGFALEGTLREAMTHRGVRCDFHVMGLLSREWRARSSEK
jgi:RimJ/RimL family protein N-acetyltransferase